jgi:hypothetical protein
MSPAFQMSPPTPPPPRPRVFTWQARERGGAPSLALIRLSLRPAVTLSIRLLATFSPSSRMQQRLMTRILAREAIPRRCPIFTIIGILAPSPRRKSPKPRGGGGQGGRGEVEAPVEELRRWWGETGEQMESKEKKKKRRGKATAGSALISARRDRSAYPS